MTERFISSFAQSVSSSYLYSPFLGFSYLSFPLFLPPDHPVLRSQGRGGVLVLGREIERFCVLSRPCYAANSLCHCQAVG